MGILAVSVASLQMVGIEYYSGHAGIVLNIFLYTIVQEMEGETDKS